MILVLEYCVCECLLFTRGVELLLKHEVLIFIILVNVVVECNVYL